MPVVQVGCKLWLHTWLSCVGVMVVAEQGASKQSVKAALQCSRLQSAAAGWVVCCTTAAVDGNNWLSLTLILTHLYCSCC